MKKNWNRYTYREILEWKEYAKTIPPREEDPSYIIEIARFILLGIVILFIFLGCDFLAGLF